MKPTFSLALSDELQEIYLDFKEKRDFDQDIIIKLLKYFKGPFAINTAQYERIGREPSSAINQQLRSGGYTSQTLEELALAKTDYKVILSLDKNTYPYVNINGDCIENNLSGCFYRDEIRSKAIQHIKALCGKAKEICLYDKYITKRGSERANQETLRLLASILPHKALDIIYQHKHLEEEDVSFLQGICDKWTFDKKVNIPEHHDRYLVIDNKMEIILTSGFSYLDNSTKEFTYIVRPITRGRFG